MVFHLNDGTSVEAAEPLYHFENKMTIENGFFKCHRSYLVYMKNVDRFSGTEIITKSGRRVPIARGAGRAFKEAYFAVMFEESEAGLCC